ncbi:DEAD/DEAH box helicase [Robiginitalea myxolifaciens]|nr:DEAD/DEAH box helicase [Robiginitalea myxolifaciens]
MTFDQLALSEPILRALKHEGYTNPTPIQSQAIPELLQGKDILASAQTGTGKTAAFVIPILEKISTTRPAKKGYRPVRGLILTPTRELALQIEQSIRAYGRYTNVRYTAIYGGVKQNRQVDAVRRGADIIVATPGRLLDLVGQGLIDLSGIQHFVLDEADRMLDMGFINDIRRIIRELPERRQSLFFSATLPRDIVTLSKEILQEPVRVSVDPVSSTADSVTQYVYKTNRPDKNALLLHILEDPKMEQVLLFSRTKHGADKIVRNLGKAGIRAVAIHGDKSQNKRQHALKEFKAGKIRLLVATDIASRGIDIEQLGYVINFDLPNESETYVHRIGRSGRAGESGIAISLCEPEELAYLKDIEKLIGQSLEEVKDHPFPQTDKPMNARERKEFEKAKARRRQEHFARKKEKKNKTGKKPKAAAAGNEERSRKNKPSGKNKSHRGKNSKSRAGKPKRSNWGKKKTNSSRSGRN